MSEREEHNELIHRLAERLRNHTEPYKEGAWERFSATYGKRRRMLWPYWSAAAVMLAVVGSYWLTHQPGKLTEPHQHAQQNVASRPIAPPVTDEVVLPQDSAGEMIPRATSEAAVRPAVATRTGGSPSDRADALQRAVAAAAETLQDEAPAMETVAEVDEGPTPGPEPQRLAIVAGQDEQEGRSDLLPDTYDRTAQKPGANAAKWDLGLMLSPSLTSETVNLGGGLTVAYRITDRLSIGSGIAIAQMGVGENTDYQPGFASRQSDLQAAPSDPEGGLPVFNGRSEAALSYKQEVSMTSRVVTLDIPLDIRYDVAKGFYTSVGVSYVAVLNEQRTGHYVDKINSNTFGNGHSGGADRLAPTVFTYSSEKIQDKPLQGKGYAGFLNFSVGKKLPLSSKLFLSVEPYFKMPIGRLSREEMDFTNGGIRIVTGF